MKKVISKDGTSIAYDQIGEGQPLILVDGALCYRSFGPMPKLAPLLAKHFTVFMYDRRGRGDSSNGQPYSVQREVEDIEALIKEAGGSAFVFGISSGAGLALRAAESKLNITKLALYEPPFVFNKNGGKPAVDHESQLKSFIRQERRGDAVKYFMTTMVGAPAIFAFIMQFTPAWNKLKAVAHTLPYDTAIMGDFSVPTERVSSVKIPTLIAGGGKSPAPLRNAVNSVANVLPNGTLRILKGQSHNVKADVLAPLLTKFFTS